MKKTEIFRTFGIPVTTLRDWEKRKDWRKNLLNFLKEQDYKKLKMALWKTL